MVVAFWSTCWMARSTLWHVRDVSVKETKGGGERAADGFRVRAECRDVVASGVVGGDRRS